MKLRWDVTRGGRALATGTLLLLQAGIASAQTTGTLVGTVTDAATGKPVAGALVTATSPALQGEQAVISDGAGRFTITLLPPGRYRLAAHLQGYLPAERGDLVLRVDYTLRANLVLAPEVVTAPEQVVRTGAAPAVNVGNAEEGTVISREFLATVPTTRDYEGTMIVVPTALQDVGGIAFAGATSPENNYVLDGFRVGDPVQNFLGVNLLTNFVEQLDVKTGGFLPEYGYTSAGVVNAVLKSGSNELHGSLWGNLTPGLFTPASDVVGRNGEAVASYASPYKGSYDADFGIEVGGPIVKDRLWFYAGLATRLQYAARTGFYRARVPSAADPSVSAFDRNGLFVMQPIPGTEFVYGSGTNTVYGVAKLTWLAGEDHTLFASLTTQPWAGSGRYGVNGTAPATYRKDGGNSTSVTMGYGGKFLDKHLLVEANLGWYDSPYRTGDATVDGVPIQETPGITWRTLQPLQNFDPTVAASCPSPSRQAAIGSAPGCYVQNYGTGGGGFIQDSDTWRLGGSFSLTALFSLLGQHVLKGGVQIDYSTYGGTEGYGGGSSWTAWGRFLGPGVQGSGGSFNAFQLWAYGQLDPANAIPQPSGPPIHANWCAGGVQNGACVNPGGKDTTNPYLLSIRSNGWSNGYYLQDSWTIANVLTLGFGVRLDTQRIANASPEAPPWSPVIDVGDMWGPRAQAIWDFTGQGRGKVQASWGRYYESIPLMIAMYGLASAPGITGAYQLTSCSAAMIPGPTSRGNPAASCPNVYGLAAGAGPGPNTRDLSASPLTDAGFIAQSPYEPVAPGLKGQYTDQFGGGVQYEVLQDLTLGVEYLGRRQGTVVEDMSSTEGLSYFIANPGVSQPWKPTSGPYQGKVSYNPRYAVSLDGTTGTNYLEAFPVPVRSYDSVTVSLAKLFSRRWLAQASYTWSSLRGNYSGLIRTDTGQFMPNLTTEYDLVSALGNRYGPLGNNREHQVKAAASYLVGVSERVTFLPGLQLVAVSGTPVNVWGAHPQYGTADAFLLPRGSAGNLPWRVNLDLSARADWIVAPSYTLSFSLSLFNVLDSQAATAVDQRYTFDFATPLQNAPCSSRDAMRQGDPLAAIVRNCPDLAYARTLDGRPVSPNLNYGRATAYQVPVSARFGVALTF